MSLVGSLLVLLLVVVIAYAILDRIGLPGDVKSVVVLVLGVLFLIVLLSKLGFL